MSTSTSALLLAFLLAAPQIAPAQEAGETAPMTVRDWADAYAEPVLASQNLPVGGQTLTFGHLDLTLASGELRPVLAGGKAVGLFFSGSGTMRYVSNEPYEWTTYRRNVKRASSYDVAENGSITDSFSKALIMLSPGAEHLPENLGWTPGTQNADFRAHLDRWSKDRIWRYTQLMPQAMIEAPSTPMAVIEIEANRHDLVYTYDPLRDYDEHLVVMRDLNSRIPDMKGFRYADLLSLQPIGRTRLDVRPRRFLMKDLEVEVVNPEGQKADVKIRQTIEAQAPLRTIELRLAEWFMGTASASLLPEKLDYELRRLTDGQGREPAYSKIDNDLVIELSEPLAAGERIELHYELAGDILDRPGNDSYWRLNGAWYPQPHRWAMTQFTYRGVFKAAKPFVPFSNGRTIRRWEEDGMNCVEMEETLPMQLAVALAGKYDIYSEERDGYTVRVGSYGINKPKASKLLASIVFDLIEFYDLFLGEYPFKEINLLEMNSVGWAQAPGGIIYVTREAFNPVQNSTFSQGINQRMAHEMAHAWWGHVAKLSDLEDQWISESIADYYSAVAANHLWGKRQWEQAMLEWQGGAREAQKNGSVYLGNFVRSKLPGPDRYNLLYRKGPLVLHALREEIGDQAFFTILRSFLKSFPWQPAYTKDFIELTNFITKQDYGPWFEKYLFGEEMPEIKGKKGSKKKKG